MTEEDYEIEFLGSDATKPDLSDATFIRIRETFSMKEYRKRVAEGKLPDVAFYGCKKENKKLKQLKP
jgi:hypothetical protein